MQDTNFFYSHSKDTLILMGKCAFQNQSEQLTTYFHSDKNGRKHEGSDWDFELCLSGSLQSELLICPHQMQIPKMITLAGLLTC